MKADPCKMLNSRRRIQGMVENNTVFLSLMDPLDWNANTALPIFTGNDSFPFENSRQAPIGMESL